MMFHNLSSGTNLKQIDLGITNGGATECFFNLIKRRVPDENATLLDVFKAFDFSEEVALRNGDPSVPTLPDELKAVLNIFVPSDVQES